MLFETARLHLVRVVIQTTSPLAIYSGNREKGFDNQLSRDANGLPTIPASTFSGIWRHLTAQHLGKGVAQDWFGTTEKRARLSVSEGHLHDSHNRPMAGLVASTHLQQDSLLSFVSQATPASRERVRINDRGVASNEGKFDQVLLPTGMRFCLDFRWYEDDQDLAEQFAAMLALLQQEQFALGSSTRNGLGQFNVVGCKQQTLDLRQEGASDTLAKFNQRLDIPVHCDLPKPKSEPLARLQIQADSTWRCGTSAGLLDNNNKAYSPDAQTFSERPFVWKCDVAERTQEPIAMLCGSSIKGMFLHRLEYHLNCTNQRWASDEIDNNEWDTRQSEINQIFGSAGDLKNNEQGMAGQILFTDSVVEYKDTVVRNHNQIDRFTSGVIQGALFNEELLYQPTFEIEIYLVNSQGKLKCSAAFKQALEATFDDMRSGRLSLGSQTGRGNSCTAAKPDGKWQIDWSKLDILTEPFLDTANNTEAQGI